MRLVSLIRGVRGRFVKAVAREIIIINFFYLFKTFAVNFTYLDSFLLCNEYGSGFWKVAALLSLLVHTQLGLTLSSYHLTVRAQVIYKHAYFDIKSHHVSHYFVHQNRCLLFPYISKY